MLYSKHCPNGHWYKVQNHGTLKKKKREFNEMEFLALV